MSVAFDDLPGLEDTDGNKFYLVDYEKPTTLTVWDSPIIKDGMNISKLRKIDLNTIGVEVLSKLSIWKEIPIEIQENLKNHVQIKREAVVGLMEKARNSRRKKYPGIPKQIKCTECGGMIDVVPSMIGRKIEKKGIMLDDYIRTYVCTLCHPRGRPKNAV
jgi:hypothetical protein